MSSDWLAGLHISSDLLPTGWAWFLDLLFMLALLHAMRRFGWSSFVAGTRQQHVYFGGVVLLLVIWGFKAGVSPGLGFHHLGATLFTLMFGWARAIVGLTLTLLASYALQSPDWVGVGVNGLLSIALPVWFSHGLLLLSWRLLPHNFFVYIYVCAFFGAALSVAIGRLAAAGVLYASGAYSGEVLWDESIVILPLLMFPEAFITGLLITMFVVYLPDWVSTFDDERYLKGK